MRRTLAVLPLLALAVTIAGCATPSTVALPPTPTATADATPATPSLSSTPTPTLAPTPTQSAPVLTLGYTFEQIAAVCIPAVEAEYDGVSVTGRSEHGPWLTDDGNTATFEWLTYVPDTVTWTTNTNITFPALCSITDADPSTPTVVYVGVADR